MSLRPEPSPLAVPFTPFPVAAPVPSPVPAQRPLPTPAAGFAASDPPPSLATALLAFYGGSDLPASDPLAVELSSIASLSSLLELPDEVVLDLIHRFVAPSALLAEMTALLQRRPAVHGQVRRALLAALTTVPRLPTFSSPPPEDSRRRPLTPSSDVAANVEDTPLPTADLLLRLPPLPGSARRAANCFLSAASSSGYEVEEAVGVLRESLTPLPHDFDPWTGVVSAATVLLDTQGSPAKAWRVASQRLGQLERASSHFRTSARDASSAPPDFHRSPRPLRRCLDDPTRTEAGLVATPAPPQQPPPSSSAPAGFSTGPSSAFSTPSHFSPAGPLGPQMPPPAAFTAPPVPPSFSVRPSPQLSSFLSSVHTQVPRTAMEFANALSLVPAPAWYTAAALSTVSSRSHTASPLAWDSLLQQELGAITWVMDPRLDPSSAWGGAAFVLPTGPFHVPPPTADSLRSRLTSASYNSQRGLFVTDLGRLLLRHISPGSPAAVAAVFTTLLQAVRESGYFTRSGQSISRAERLPDRHEGVSTLLELIDSHLFVAERGVARRRWESKAWADEQLSAVELLSQLREDAYECGKDDEAVLDRWAGAVHAAFVDNQRPIPLAMLKNSFLDPAQRPYSSVTELLHQLKQHSYGDWSLHQLVAGSGPSSAPPPRRHRAVEVAAAEPASELAGGLARVQLSTQAAAAPHASRRPAPLPLPAADAPDAEVLAFMTSGRLVGGHADIPRIQKSGRLPVFCPPDSTLPLHDAANKSDGKFRLNCPFCGTGSSCRVQPVRCYANVSEYNAQNGSQPFGAGVSRPLPSNERIAHLPSRCPELWHAIRQHVQSHPEDKWMRDEPLSDADFYARVPAHCNFQRRR